MLPARSRRASAGSGYDGSFKTEAAWRRYLAGARSDREAARDLASSEDSNVSTTELPPRQS